MSFITGDIKHILSISLKTRYDGLSDQYNRLFMIKLLIICSLIIGFDYFNDTVSCILPAESTLTPSFVSSTCWIEGFYVYRELDDERPKSGYYGIPKDLRLDGMYKGTKDLCKVDITSSICQPMTKSYYTQHQYITFYTAALAVLYYFPYILFRLANHDIICLRKSLDGGGRVDLGAILRNFFDYSINSKHKMRIRNLMNITVKLLYISVNVMAFAFTDAVLGGRYKDYGVKWVSWAQQFMSSQYGDLPKHVAKPGNQLLPSMGICQIHEASEDITSTIVNSNRLVCELSPHVLYQYCFLVLWFSIIFGICISGIGFLSLIIGYISHLFGFMESTWINQSKSYEKLYKNMTLREREYLDFIKAKNASLHNALLRQLLAYRDHVEDNRDELVSITSSLTKDEYDSESTEDIEFM